MNTTSILNFFTKAWDKVPNFDARYSLTDIPEARSFKVTTAAATAFSIGIYFTYKKFWAQRESPFLLEKLFKEEEYLSYLIGNKYLPIDDVLALRRSFSEVPKNLDINLLTKRIYKPIIKEIFQELLKPISPIVITRVVEILSKYDTKAALKIARELPMQSRRELPMQSRIEALLTMQSRIEALLTIAQSIAVEKPQEAMGIYEGLFENLLERQCNIDSLFFEEVPGDDDFFSFDVMLILAKSVEPLDKERYEEMFKEIVNKARGGSTLLRTNPLGDSLFKMYENMAVLSYGAIKRLTRKCHELSRDVYILNELIDTGRFSGDEEIFMGMKGPSCKKLDFFLIVEIAKMNLRASVDLIEKYLANDRDTSKCVEVLIQISENLSETDLQRAKELLERAREVAKENRFGENSLALVGKKLSSMGRKQEADQLFNEAEKIIRKYRYFKKISFYALASLAQEIRNHNPEKANELFEEVLCVVNPNEEHDNTFYLFIADKAPASFWQNKPRKMQKLAKKFDPHFRLLYLLKMLDTCKYESIRTSFAQKLRRLSSD